MACLPAGATDLSYAVWKYSSHHSGDGWPRRLASQADWVASMPVEMVTMALCGVVPSAACGNDGSLDSPQLILSTGLSLRHAATRSRNSAGTSRQRSND